ncbi:RHS repeat-associated core domain-containing protein [Actinokineospora sp. HUAS TT18]|uniref:RHS repeat-associated core domain-containing protein n=1 Tax=Actinokineospora sp. HUAS TT18 TaxID=3447451 RepID=UPI003F51DF2C
MDQSISLHGRARWGSRWLSGLLVAVLAAAGTVGLSGLARADAQRSGNSGLLGGQSAPGVVSLAGGGGGASGDGGFGFGYPVSVPSGRGGQAPEVGLSYSSGAAVHGGVAAGWRLGVPVISVDPTGGTMRTEWPQGGSAEAPRNFVGPDGNPLVRDESLPTQSGGVGYRALNDGSFARYEFLGGVAAEPYWWRVFHADGTLSLYGLKSDQPYSFAPLVLVKDGDDHQLRYVYATVGRTTAVPAADHPREFVPSAIEYWSPGASHAYAKVLFQYDNPRFCGDAGTGVLPVGSRLDYTLGFGLLSGTRKLQRIVTVTQEGPAAALKTAREYVLNYDAGTESCTGAVTPFRQLNSVQPIVHSPNITGPAAVKWLPPTEFTYGKAASYVNDAQYEAPVAVPVPNLRLPESVDTVQHPFANPDQPETYTFAPGGWSTAAVPFGAVPETKKPHGQYSSASIPWAVAVGQATGESLSRSFVDVNGDGLVDILARAEGNLRLAAAAPATGGCVVDVYLNKGPDQGFVKQESGGEFPPFSMRDAMADVPVPAGTVESGAGELLCSLSRSFSSDDSGGWMGDPSKPCSAQEEWDTTAGWGSMQQVVHGFQDIDRDGYVDLLSQPIASVHCPYESTHGIPDPNESLPEDPSDPTKILTHWTEHGGFMADSMLHNRDAEDRFPDFDQYSRIITKRQTNWYVYRNTGSGFASTPTVLTRQVPAPPGAYDPQPGVYVYSNPLPTDGIIGGYTLPWQGSVSYPSMDMNADGMTDAVGEMYVYPGKPDGTTGYGLYMTSREGACYGSNDPFCDTRNQMGFHRKRTGYDDLDNPTHYTGFPFDSMFDINGDGLPDQIQSYGTYAQVDFHTGAGLGSDVDGGRVKYSENHPLTQYMDRFRAPDLSNRNWQSYPTTGERHGLTRMIDLDYDGLLDTLSYDGATGQLFLNGGARWVRETPAQVEIARTLAGRIDARGTLAEYADRGDYHYTATRTAIDLNGDGLLDLVEDVDNDGTPSVRYAKQNLDTADAVKAPARLLRTVKNGYGAKTTVDYKRDTEVGKWLVDKITVNPGQNEPAMVTRHKYLDPHYGSTAYGARVFRGYGDVRQVREGPQSAGSLTVVTRMAFDQDYRGLPSRVVTIRGDALDVTDPDAHPNTATVVDNTYTVRELGLRAPGMLASFPSRVVLPDTTTTYTCTGSDGQTATACVAGAPKTVTTTGWDDHTVGGAYVMELPTFGQTEFVNADGQTEIRRTTTTSNVAWSDVVFNVAPESVTSSSVVDGVSTDLGATYYAYEDPVFRRVQTVSVDDADSSVPVKVTRYAYYGGAGADRGLVRRVWAPEQVYRYGAGDPLRGGDDAPGFTEFVYDAVGVHVTRVTNPVGQVVTSTVDLGTGATLSAEGPDYVCADGTAQTCSFDQAAYRQRVQTKVDGLGRPVENTVFPASAAAGVVVSRATYKDSDSYMSGGYTPVSTITETASGDGDFTYDTTEIDGLGRVVRTMNQRSPQPGGYVEYDYDAAGRVSLTRTTQGGGLGTLTMQTLYDALDRPVEVKKTSPNTQADPARTLSTVAYDGLTVTASRVTGDGSPASVTKSTMDAAGQLVLVQEKTGVDAGGANVFASTTYRYDGAGRTRQIADPDGVVTTLAHDYSGNRTAITSAGRTWAYGYDRNDDMTTVTEPVPAGADAAAYTRHTTYDDLGRVTRERPGVQGENPQVRDLDAAELAEFKIGDKRYFYDRKPDTPPGGTDPCPTIPANAAHMTGRLVCTVSPVLTTENRYTDRGHPQSTSQTLHALAGTGITADRVQVDYTTDATGTLESHTTTTIDATGAVSYQGPTVATHYDRDGTPSTTNMQLGAGNANLTITNTRNAAGLVTTRNTNTDNTAGYASPTMNFTYDPFGRVTGIDAKNIGVQRYKQNYTYNHAGQIRQTTEQLGDTTQPLRTTDYTYDHRDQLLTATQYGGSTLYNGVFTHTPGGRINTANVSTIGGTRVPSRNVTHRYQNPTQGGDPQRLDALIKPDNTPLTDYTYDDAGNTTSRTLPDGTTLTQRWDGPRLRKTTRATGETETFFYDGHTRVAAIQRDTTGTITTAKHWAGNLETLHTPNVAPQHRLTITLAGQVIGRLDGDKTTGTFEHYLTTPLGHHVLALNATDATTKRVASYGPYGELITHLTNAGTPTNKYPTEFNGKDYDTTGGLHYYGHRYYDPHTLAWTSSDPLFRFAPDLEQTNPRAANLYTYTDNNPITRHDPNGLCESRSTCASLPLTNEHFQDGLSSGMSILPVIVGELVFGATSVFLGMEDDSGRQYKRDYEATGDHDISQVLSDLFGLLPIPGPADEAIEGGLKSGAKRADDLGAADDVDLDNITESTQTGRHDGVQARDKHKEKMREIQERHAEAMRARQERIEFFQKGGLAKFREQLNGIGSRSEAEDSLYKILRERNSQYAADVRSMPRITGETVMHDYRTGATFEIGDFGIEMNNPITNVYERLISW